MCSLTHSSGKGLLDLVIQRMTERRIIDDVVEGRPGTCLTAHSLDEKPTHTKVMHTTKNKNYYKQPHSDPDRGNDSSFSDTR